MPDPIWRGEMLWPLELPEADLIDLREVTALGTWAWAWFRQRPGQRVCNAAPTLRAQLDQAGLPLRWSDPPPLQTGVGREERDLLLG